MPYKEKEIEKIYHSITEVAGIFKVNASLIRFWEKEFDILKPTKNSSGKRFYTKDDIENLRKVYHLVKERGYTIQGAREKLKNKKSDTEKEFQMVSSLKKIRGFLSELKKELGRTADSGQ